MKTTIRKSPLLVKVLILLAIVGIGIVFGLGLEGRLPFYEKFKCRFVKNGKVIPIRTPPLVTVRCVEVYEHGGARCFNDEECEGKCIFTCDKMGKEGVCQYHEGWWPEDDRYWDKTIGSCVIF